MFDYTSKSSTTSESLGQALTRAGISTAGLVDHGYCLGRRIDFLSFPLLAQGGEGWIVDATAFRSGELAKVFKPPAMVSSEEQETANQKWDEYPRKLPELFNFDLPANAVKPSALIGESRSRGSRVLGYFMPGISGFELTELTTADGRKQRGYRKNDVIKIFAQIHTLTERLHTLGIVVGDSKPQNYVIGRRIPHLVDLESTAFGGFKCYGSTEPYLDPLLCDPGREYPKQIAEYSPLSDWYAFEAMLFECLAGIPAYGGVCPTSDGTDELPAFTRALLGISVCNPRVGVADFVEPFSLLPKDLFEHAVQTFEAWKRERYPRELLDVTWTECAPCQIEHAQPRCPVCRPVAEHAFLKVPGRPAMTVAVERQHGNGAVVSLGRRGDTARILRVNADHGCPRLTLDGKVVMRDLSPRASLAAAAHPDVIWIATGSDQVSGHSISGRKGQQLEGLLRGETGPLFGATPKCFAFFDHSGDLSLGTYTAPESCYRIPLAAKHARFFALGDQILAYSDGAKLSILHGQEQPKKFLLSQVHIEPSETLISISSHPTRMYVLAAYARANGEHQHFVVYSERGSVELDLRSAKPTVCWFGERLVNDCVTLIYWQDDKLCEAVIRERRLHQLWGLREIPQPKPEHPPLIIRDQVYFVFANQVYRTPIM